MHGVDDDYRHCDKLVTPRGTIRHGKARLKWYDLAPAEEPVPSDVHQLAQRFLSSAPLDLGDDLGFVILHRCGREFYFLLVSSWRGNNELWESVYAKKSEAHPDFALFTFEGTHRGTFCVWEMGAVWHEQQAWKRYLRSARDDAARDVYLGDCFSGSV
jgi:hypothetical protein